MAVLVGEEEKGEGFDGGTRIRTGTVDPEIPAAADRLFSRRVAGLAEAEDMTQEVFLRLMNAQGNSEETNAAYIFRIAANLVTDRARHDRVRRNFADGARSDGSAGIDGFDPFRIASAREVHRDPVGRDSGAARATQQIFILYRVENIPKQTIADNFGFHLRTVDKHIARALVFLARRMERRP